MSSASEAKLPGNELLTETESNLNRPSRYQDSQLARFKTGAEVACFWGDPNRPRLTPEEAQALEDDIKAGRAMLIPGKDAWE